MANRELTTAIWFSALLGAVATLLLLAQPLLDPASFTSATQSFAIADH